jgi:hypothetical protein
LAPSRYRAERARLSCGLPAVQPPAGRLASSSSAAPRLSATTVRFVPECELFGMAKGGRRHVRSVKRLQIENSVTTRTICWRLLGRAGRGAQKSSGGQHVFAGAIIVYLFGGL